MFVLTKNQDNRDVCWIGEFSPTGLPMTSRDWSQGKKFVTRKHAYEYAKDIQALWWWTPKQCQT